MSRENLELVMRASRALTRRPAPDWSTVNELVHPDHVFVSVPGGRLGEGTAKGAQGYKAWLEDQAEVMPFESDVDGAVDIAPDIVLVASTLRARGAASGIQNDYRLWSVVTVAEGKIVRSELFLSPGEAIAAAGIAG